MTTPSPQEISTVTLNSLSKEERKKAILALQTKKNEIKLVIDEHQKKLAEFRQSIPDGCCEMFENEKKIRLKHSSTAELLPHLQKVGSSSVDKEKMINNIRQRVEVQVADQETFKSIEERNELLRRENENLKKEVNTVAAELLQEFESYE